MKERLRRALAHPKYARALEWGRLISVVGSGQMLVQGLGLASGFLIIHMVSPAEYALYTLAYSMLGTIGPLADGGVSHGVFARGAKEWQDKTALGRVVASGMELRKKFAFVTLAICLPILFVLLMRHDAGWIAASLIVITLVPAFYAMLTDDLLQVPVRLNQDVTALQKNEVIANVVRLIALVGGLFVLPFAAIAILANGLPRIWANFKLRKVAERYATLTVPSDPAAKRDILDLTKRTLPGTLYYGISGQVSIWLISIFGNTHSIAEVGALGRLAMALTILGTIFSTLITPRFARLAESSTLLRRRFLQIWALMMVLVVCIPAVVHLFPTQVLAILGRNYMGLTTEVVLSVLGACLGMATGSIYALSVARRWVIRPDISITLSIAVHIALILSLDLSTTRNVLLYGILNAAWGVVMYTGYFLFRIHTLRKEERQGAAAAAAAAADQKTPPP